MRYDMVYLETLHRLVQLHINETFEKLYLPTVRVILRPFPLVNLVKTVTL